MIISNRIVPLLKVVIYMQEVLHIIDQIISKTTLLKENLNQEKSINHSLKEQIIELTSKLDQKQKEVEELSNKLQSIEPAPEFNIQVESENSHNELIKDLVQEIDDCIAKLKNNG